MTRDRAIRLFQLFGTPLRLVVFQRVSRNPQTASELARELPVSRSAIVQHLTLLKSFDLVRSAREERGEVYCANPAALKPLRDWVNRYGP